MSTVTNTTSSAILDIHNVKSSSIRDKNPKPFSNIHSGLIELDSRLSHSTQLSKKDNLQTQTVGLKIISALQQTNKQPAKHNYHGTNTRQKHTSVWVDKSDKSSESFEGLEPLESQKNHTNTDSLAPTTQLLSSHTVPLKRKTYSAHSDDPGKNSSLGGSNDHSTNYLKSNVKQSKHGDYQSSNSSSNDHGGLPLSTSGSSTAQGGKTIRLKKNPVVQRFPQKVEKTRQQRKSFDSSIEAALQLAKINSLQDWSSDEATKWRNGHARGSSDSDKAELVTAKKQASYISRRKWRSMSEANHNASSTNTSSKVSSDVVVEKNQKNIQPTLTETEIHLNGDADTSEKITEDFEALSSETEIVLYPRNQRHKDTKIVNYETTADLKQTHMPNELKDTIYGRDEGVSSFGVTKPTLKCVVPQHSYQVTVSCHSKTNPHALFPIWDNNALETMRVVSEAFKDMPGILDENDEDTYDISMVAEYTEEIFDYMRNLEFKYRPDPGYMDKQVEISWEKRDILVDWLVRVHSHCNLLPETLFLTVNYIDRFLSVKTIEQCKLQLVGIAALFIAAKYEEIKCPSVQELAHIVQNEYSVDDILRAERYMIDMLDFNMGWPGPMSFLRRSSKADEYDFDTRTLAKYFLELTIMDQRFVSSQPSWLAAAAHCLARTVLNTGKWSDLHVYFGGYTKKQLDPAIEIIIDACKKPHTHHHSIFEKYTDPQFNWASLHVAEWIYETYRVDTRRSK